MIGGASIITYWNPSSPAAAKSRLIAGPSQQLRRFHRGLTARAGPRACRAPGVTGSPAANLRKRSLQGRLDFAVRNRQNVCEPRRLWQAKRLVQGRPPHVGGHEQRPVRGPRERASEPCRRSRLAFLVEGSRDEDRSERGGRQLEGDQRLQALVTLSLHSSHDAASAAKTTDPRNTHQDRQLRDARKLARPLRRGRSCSRPMTNSETKKSAANAASTPFRKGRGEAGALGGSAASASASSVPTPASATAIALRRSRMACASAPRPGSFTLDRAHPATLCGLGQAFPARARSVP